MRYKPADDVPERLEIPERQALPWKETPPPAQYEAAVTALEQCLMLKRYSWRTIKTYKNCFRQFIKYYDHIKKLLESVDNLKHRCILALINMRIEDIQPESRRIFVRAAKGKRKDSQRKSGDY